MLLSPGKHGLTSLFKEVRAFKARDEGLLCRQKRQDFMDLGWGGGHAQ